MLSLLRMSAYRNPWLAGAFTGVARWIQILAIGIYAFDATGSPFVVAGLTFLRMVPLAPFSTMVGALTDVLSPRTVFILGCTVMAAADVAQALLVWTGAIEVWHLAIGSFLGGMFWAMDFPARRNLLGVAAGPQRTVMAMAVDQATNTLTRALGPALGGGLLALVGLGGAFAVGVVLHLLSILLFLQVRTVSRPPAPRSSLWRDVAEGFRYAAGNRVIKIGLAVTIVYNLWVWPFTTMVPVIGRDYLGLGAFSVGMLMSAEGVGACAGSIFVALFARPRALWAVYLLGVIAALAMVLAFSLATVPALAGIAVFAIGVGSGCITAMQTAIIFLAAAPAVRGRMLGVLMACIGLSPLGILHVGWMAEGLGAPLAMTIMACEGLAVVCLFSLVWPEMRRLRNPEGAFKMTPGENQGDGENTPELPPPPREC